LAVVVTCANVMIYRCRIVKFQRVDNMIFLSATTVLVTCPLSGFIELYDFQDPAVSDNGLTCLSRFSLPALQFGCKYSNLFIGSHSPASRTCSPIPSFKESSFQASPEDRICSVCVLLHDALGTSMIFTLYIHIRVFLGFGFSCFVISQEPRRLFSSVRYLGPKEHPLVH
jgi:hypothetical protein